jgi:8-oxo-dGTP pyrophosphatase MutT (NUDIX family)
MKFNNIENECVTTTDGRQIWVSRSVAVVAIVCIVKDKKIHFLLGQRGKGAADYHGMWCLPCGYLDWNETTFDAARREVWEETGIDVSGWGFVGNTQEEPFLIVSDPAENRQNISITYVFIRDIEKNQELPQPNIVNHVQDEEVADVRWVVVDELDNYQFAFKHKERIKSFLATLSF